MDKVAMALLAWRGTCRPYGRWRLRAWGTLSSFWAMGAPSFMALGALFVLLGEGAPGFQGGGLANEQMSTSAAGALVVLFWARGPQTETGGPSLLHFLNLKKASVREANILGY